MGFPNLFSYGFWDSPILTRGLWDSPCPFSAFLRRSFVSVIITFIARPHEFPWVFPSLLLDRGHWGDIGCTSVYDMNWRSRPILTVNSQKFDPKNVHGSGKFPKELSNGPPRIEGTAISPIKDKKENSLHEGYPTTVRSICHQIVTL